MEYGSNRNNKSKIISDKLRIFALKTIPGNRSDP